MIRVPSLRVVVVSAALIAGGEARAQEVIAVLSDASRPYQAAFDSFQKEFGRPVAAFRLPGDEPSAGARTHVVVAFGGEAASRPYPEGEDVIACLAPGLSGGVRRGRFASVDMNPSPDAMLTRLRRIQPGLRRLAVLWSSAGMAAYLKDLERVAATLGMEIVSVRADGPKGVPDALRNQRGKADALWLAPDPALVTPEAFQTIKQFSWDNAVPFYAPTAGLVAAGAAGAVSVGDEEMGRQAAALVRRALSGASLAETIYPAKTELTLNPESAAKAGLVFSPEILGEADRVVH
ncbi:MAG TPA: ABC transporter substrate binding protein [Elusimicrobiota bacterium]|jgi:hypothetical protein|nr:ABC transporter substrate binding protein [Elusimicrobiota bacterium]